MRFFFFDHISEFEPGRRAAAIKFVSTMDEYLPEHYDLRPVMPPTLIMESLAQVGGWLHVASHGFDVRTVLGLVQGARFHRRVRPGDILTIETEVLLAHKDGAELKGTVRVGEETVAEVDRLMFISEPANEAGYAERGKQLFRYLAGDLVVSGV